MSDEQVQQEEQQQQEQEEKDARLIGWLPKEEYRGNEADFVDAKTYLEKGRQILPIVQANNQRLLGQVNALGQKLSSIETALRAANATIEVLETSHEEDVKEQVEAARAALRTELHSRRPSRMAR